MLEIVLMLIAAYCALNYAGIMCACLMMHLDCSWPPVLVSVNDPRLFCFTFHFHVNTNGSMEPPSVVVMCLPHTYLKGEMLLLGKGHRGVGGQEARG